VLLRQLLPLNNEIVQNSKSEPKQFSFLCTFNPDFGQVVVFLDCPLHHGHGAFSKFGDRMTGDQSRKVQIQVLDSDPVIQQLFYLCTKKNIKSGRVPYGTECGSGCRRRNRSLVLCGTAHFYGTGARVDAQIRTSVPDPRLILQTAYHTVYYSKNAKNMIDSQREARIRLKFIKIPWEKFF
jgi:hypothetical protein